MQYIKRVIVGIVVVLLCILTSCKSRERCVTDREEIILFLICALNNYYEDEHVYPRFLTGEPGTAITNTGLRSLDYPNETGHGRLETRSACENDELESGGYICEYPRTYPIELHCSDRKAMRRWICAVTEENDKRAVIIDKTRFLALGGVEYERNGNAEQCYSIIPGHSEVWPIESLSYFGYSHELRDSGKNEVVRVWVYGELKESARVQKWLDGEIELESDEKYTGYSHTRPLSGFDLLNAQTGELVPDGIPDGICIVATLESGRLVEMKKYEEESKQNDS